MAFSDRELTCRDCGSSFVFTSGEQEFYASKGLQHDPVRCPSCRASRKMMRPEDRDETPHYGVYVSWGGRTPRQLHVAVCSGCARSAEVPFVPRGDRPVFCSDCYNEERKRQDAQELAEAGAAAARAAGGGGGGRSGRRTSSEELEGSGREPAVAVVEAEPAAEPAAEDESAAESESAVEPHPAAEDEPAGQDERAAEDESAAAEVEETVSSGPQ